jgi:hypothetical protein
VNLVCRRRLSRPLEGVRGALLLKSLRRVVFPDPLRPKKSKHGSLQASLLSKIPMHQKPYALQFLVAKPNSDVIYKN